MLPRRLASAGAVRRALPSLGLALGVALATLAPLPPARADHAPDHEPIARLQAIVKRVGIDDDHDWHSEGDLRMYVGFHRCDSGEGDDCFGAGVSDTWVWTEFDASSGDVVVLNSLAPAGGEAASYPVYAGRQYLFRVEIADIDDVDVGDGAEDELGTVSLWLDEGNNWRIGTHTTYDTSGDYWVELEIRRAHLPELRPTSLDVKAEGPEGEVCIGVLNAGAADAGPFQVALQIDDAPAPNGTLQVPGLASGQWVTPCIKTNLSSVADNQWTYSLTAIVDGPRAIREENDANNRLEQKYVASGGVLGSGQTLGTIVQSDAGSGSAPPQPQPPPQPSPSAAKADLTVGAIKVRGRVPDGKDDCKEGKNDVTVVVKNDGAANAGGFAVRLSVDATGGEALDESVGGLEAGKEREVRFEDVRLKKGQQPLTATADSKNQVSESKEDNNERKATVNCEDDDD